MQHYARVLDGVVAEIIAVPDGLVLGVDIFTADFAAGLIVATDDAAVGMTWDGSAFGPAPEPPWPTRADLVAYANAEQWRRATGGYTATIDGTPMVFPTDTVSMGLMTGKAARLDQPDPPASFRWQTPTGFVEIAAADFRGAAIAVADFVQGTFDALAIVLSGIADGTITTIAEIDAADWPAFAAANGGQLVIIPVPEQASVKVRARFAAVSGTVSYTLSQ